MSQLVIKDPSHPKFDLYVNGNKFNQLFFHKSKFSDLHKVRDFYYDLDREDFVK